MLVAVELEAVGVAHQRPGLDAQQGVVGLVVVLVGVVAVVGGEQRRTDACGRSPSAAGSCGAARGCRGPGSRRTGCRARRCPGAAPPFRGRPRSSPRSSDCSTCPPRQPVVAMTPSLCSSSTSQSHAGLVVVALHVRPAGDLDQVLVADVVLGQQDQVVVELRSAVGLTAGVVDPAPPRRALVRVTRGPCRPRCR